MLGILSNLRYISKRGEISGPDAGIWIVTAGSKCGGSPGIVIFRTFTIVLRLSIFALRRQTHVVLRANTSHLQDGNKWSLGKG